MGMVSAHHFAGSTIVSSPLPVRIPISSYLAPRNTRPACAHGDGKHRGALVMAKHQGTLTSPLLLMRGCRQRPPSAPDTAPCAPSSPPSDTPRRSTQRRRTRSTSSAARPSHRMTSRAWWSCRQTVERSPQLNRRTRRGLSRLVPPLLWETVQPPPG